MTYVSVWLGRVECLASCQGMNTRRWIIPHERREQNWCLRSVSKIKQADLCGSFGRQWSIRASTVVGQANLPFKTCLRYHLLGVFIVQWRHSLLIKVKPATGGLVVDLTIWLNAEYDTPSTTTALVNTLTTSHEITRGWQFLL